MIALAVLTHNRVHLLRQCVDRALQRTSPETTEILIWDNASTDGTSEYLASLEDPRIQVVRSEENIGQSAYSEAFARMTAPYLVELDDDVIDAPDGWDRMLLDAFRRLPEVGFLAADLEDDPHDEAAYARHHIRPHLYVPLELHGVSLLDGPTGGGCAITSRELYERVGGFRKRRKEVFFLEDAAYIEDVARLGYRAAVLADLRVHHAGGPYYSQPIPERQAYWERYWRRQRRRQAVKRALLVLPLVRPLNERLGLFSAADG